MKKFIAAGMLLLLLPLAGCAEWQATVSGAHAAGITMAHNIADDALVAEREAFCAQPYSSLVRNSAKDASVGASAVQLCGPLTVPKVVSTDPSTITAPSAPVK